MINKLGIFIMMFMKMGFGAKYLNAGLKLSSVNLDVFKVDVSEI